MENTEQTVAGARYHGGAMLFHWLIAVLIALNFVGAWVAEDMPDAEKMQVLGNHKAFGMLILLLTALRIVWRILHAPPPLVDSLKAWEAALAKVTHGLILLLTIALPVAGWAMHSAFTGGKPVSFFGLFSFPGLPLAQDKGNAGMFHELHETFATLLLILLVLHVIAALKHQFVDRDGTMRRMLPWG